MAELLAAGGWNGSGSLGAYLREMLPDEYVVVTDPMIHGCVFSAIVVGPQGLTVLQAKDGTGEVAAEHDNGGQTTRQSNWLLEAALQAFLNDEFPALHPEIRSYIAERDTEAAWPIWRVAGTDGAVTGNLADVIAVPDALSDPDLADEARRDELGMALRDRRLIASQRASKPFIFQSGGLLKTSVEAWTVREIVAYMDRHPTDGIYHLCNGTLEQWLRDEGAPHLAWLAHEAVLTGTNDRRRALEIFLLGTGQVPRPRLLIRPKRLDMGYVLGGSSVSDAVRLRRGRGRGYLFGTLATSVSWLDLVPKDFGDNAADLVVTADTSPLLIRSEPHRASVLVTSSATAEPVSVPVQFRLVAMPSSFHRLVMYPLMGLLIAGLLGAAIGWLFAQGARALAPELSALSAILRGDAFWIVPLAVVWGVLGALRGFLQPPAWPIRYATHRWVVYTLRWATALVFVALLAVWGWGRSLGIDGGSAFYVLAALCGVAAAALPSTIGEIQMARAMRNPALQTKRRQAYFSVVRWVAAVYLLVALLAGPRVLVPALAAPQVHGTLKEAESWGVSTWERLGVGADTLVDQLYLRYYDRRVPAEPAAAPPESPAPGAGRNP